MTYVTTRLKTAPADSHEYLQTPDMSPTPLRVALFSGNYNYVRDGANQSLNRLVAYLERQRIPVRVYSPTVDVPAFPPAGDLISVPSVAIPRRPEYRLGLGLPSRLVKDIARFSPTVFHVSAPDIIGNAAIRLARKWACPVVASYHTRFETYFKYYGLGFLEPLAVRYLRNFYRRCDQVYAPSECMATILRGLGFNDDVRIWTRGVELERFDPARRSASWRAQHGIASDDVVIAFVGRLVLEKGLNLLVDVVGRLAAANVRCRLLVVGEGPERQMLQARLPEAIFTGHLAGEDLARAYAAADIFFNPSTTETFGNVTLEAMASGVATVCAAATGSRSLVAHGTTGLLATPGNAEAFATALQQIVLDRGLRSAMGQAGREAAKRYDWDRTLGDLVGHYQGVLARRRVPAVQATRRSANLKPALGFVQE